MKRIILALPLALLFASCSTQRSSTNSGSSAMSGTSSTSSTMSSSSTGTTANATATTSTNTSSRFSGYDINKYDPNNYMQNPEKYKSPRELVKTGGWTYNTEWNQMTNFLAEALGEWLLTPTEEVAAFWIPDSSRADTYASYWTPEAVAARQQAKMMAAAAYKDSLALAQGFSPATASNTKGKGLRGVSSATTGSGSTGAMGAGGVSATTDVTATTTTSDMNSMNTSGTSTPSNTRNYLMAVNGNMFAMPAINLYLQNGTFTGYTGSNQVVGTLKVDGTSLRFDQTIPSTNMSAMGGFSQTAFMERLARVDSYDVTNGQLRLKQGTEILFVLGKNAK